MVRGVLLYLANSCKPLDVGYGTKYSDPSCLVYSIDILFIFVRLVAMRYSF